MPVTDDMVAAFRAYLTGDREQWERRNAALDLDRSPDVSRAHFTLLTALFIEAVERRFGDDATSDEIVDFVADLRARGDEIAERLDPDAAERMIAMVFDDDVRTDDIPRQQTIGARMAVLTVIIRDEDPDSVEIEAFLDKARVLANEILG